MTSSTGQPLICFKCHKPGKVPEELMTYLNPDANSPVKVVLAHEVCMPIPVHHENNDGV